MPENKAFAKNQRLGGGRDGLTSSIDAFTIYRTMVTLFSCPSRSTRPMAWDSVDGFHCGSRMWTRLATERSFSLTEETGGSVTVLEEKKKAGHEEIYHIERHGRLGQDSFCGAARVRTRQHQSPGSSKAPWRRAFHGTWREPPCAAGERDRRRPGWKGCRVR